GKKGVITHRLPVLDIIIGGGVSHWIIRLWDPNGFKVIVSISSWSEDKRSITGYRLNPAPEPSGEVSVITIGDSRIVIAHDVVIIAVFDVTAVRAEAGSIANERIGMAESEGVAYLVRNPIKICRAVHVDPRLSISVRVG